MPDEADYNQCKILSNKMVFFLLLLSLIPFLPGVGGGFFGDDFLWTIDDPSNKIFYYLYSPTPGGLHYSPFHGSLIVLQQAIFGYNVTWPLHIIQIGFHLVLALIIFKLSLLLGFEYVAALLASLFFTLNQATVSSVIGNDAFGQLMGTLFGTLSIYYLLKYYRNNEENKKYFPFVFSLFLIFMALLMKETSASFLALAGIIILWKNFRKNELTKSLYHIITEGIPYIISFVIYFIIRSQIVVGNIAPSSTDDRYSIHLGINIPINIIELIVSMLNPISTPRVMQAFAERDFVLLSLFGMTVVMIGLFIALGTIFRLSKRDTIYLFCLLLLSFFPIAIIRHVSEHYAYNSLPLLSILFGGACIRLYQGFKGSTIAKYAFICLLAAFLAGHSISTTLKGLAMKSNGEQASVLLEEISKHVDKITPGGTLYLVNRPQKVKSYSVFQQNDFDLVFHGKYRLYQLFNTDDFRVVILDNPASQIQPMNEKGVFLTLDENDNALVMQGQ